MCIWYTLYWTMPYFALVVGNYDIYKHNNVTLWILRCHVRKHFSRKCHWARVACLRFYYQQILKDTFIAQKAIYWYSVRNLYQYWSIIINILILNIDKYFCVTMMCSPVQWRMKYWNEFQQICLTNHDSTLKPSDCFTTLHSPALQVYTWSVFHCVIINRA